MKKDVLICAVEQERLPLVSPKSTLIKKKYVQLYNNNSSMTSSIHSRRGNHTKGEEEENGRIRQHLSIDNNKEELEKENDSIHDDINQLVSNIPQQVSVTTSNKLKKLSAAPRKITRDVKRHQHNTNDDVLDILESNNTSYSTTSSSSSDNSISHHRQLSSTNKELMIETIHRMLIQEQKIYFCEDYINENVTEPKLDLIFIGHDDDNTNQEFFKQVDVSCREKICIWYHQIVAYFKVDHEAIYLAMSYLDRFLMRCNVDRRTYQIATAASLVIAFKLVLQKGNRRISKTLEEIIPILSKGRIQTADIYEMETILLKAISWCIYPPTPTNYVICLLSLLSPKPILLESDINEILSLSILFVELSIRDYFFVTKRQSLIAYSAILNAMEELAILVQQGKTFRTSNIFIVKFIEEISTILNVH